MCNAYVSNFKLEINKCKNIKYHLNIYMFCGKKAIYKAKISDKIVPVALLSFNKWKTATKNSGIKSANPLKPRIFSKYK